MFLYAPNHSFVLVFYIYCFLAFSDEKVSNNKVSRLESFQLRSNTSLTVSDDLTDFNEMGKKSIVLSLIFSRSYNLQGSVFKKQLFYNKYFMVSIFNGILSFTLKDLHLEDDNMISSACYLNEDLNLYNCFYTYLIIQFDNEIVDILWRKIRRHSSHNKEDYEVICKKSFIFINNEYKNSKSDYFIVGPLSGHIGFPSIWLATDNHNVIQNIFNLCSTLTGKNTKTNVGQMLYFKSRFKRAVSNACSSLPCKNGGSCTLDNSSSYGYKCDCNSKNIIIFDNNAVVRNFSEGWSGVNCEVDINECNANPCFHGALCQNSNGSFACFCGPQNYVYYSGTYCLNRVFQCTINHVELNITKGPICLNNATCVEDESPSLFKCMCLAGYEGRRCQNDINECEVPSAPCVHATTCKDLIARYECVCEAGWTGINCTINIDDCVGRPCGYGVCIDKINAYECDCTDSGFQGINCSINIDDCANQPCHNGANCTDGIKDYNCSCYYGYGGKNCDIDINECGAQPCAFSDSGSLCLQKSNQEWYKSGGPYKSIAPFNGTFQFAAAAGYVCKCALGSEGERCQVNIDDCQNNRCKNQANCTDLLNDFRCICLPGYESKDCSVDIDECQLYKACKNAAKCVDKVADYSCVCASTADNRVWAGKNCSTELTLCKTSPCQNNAACTPQLLNEASNQQDFKCSCPSGWSGKICNVSSIMSFDGSVTASVSLIKNVQLRRLSLSYRTTLLNACLLKIALLNGSGVMQLELKAGKLFFLEQQIQVFIDDDSSLNRVGDMWINVSFSFGVDEAGGVVRVNSQKNIPFSISSAAAANYTNFNATLCADVDTRGRRFRGCLKDVFINDDAVVLENSLKWSDYAGVVLGSCVKNVQCQPSTCQSNSTLQCLDLWNDYFCLCKRPYYGLRCEIMYPTLTFGYNYTKSYIQLNSALNLTPSSTTSLSFYFITREDNAFVAYLGSESSESSSNSSFLAVAVENGYLIGKLKLGTNTTVLTAAGGAQVNDGQWRFVWIYREQRNARFVVMLASQFNGDTNSLSSSVNLSTSNLPDNEIFSTKFFYIGGCNESSSPSVSQRRSRRSVSSEAFASYVPTLRGLIQDVQLNQIKIAAFDLNPPDNLSVVLKPSTDGLINVQNGAVNDDVCKLLGNPCNNNSTCKNVIYNDYFCNCLPGWLGRNCSVVDHCFQTDSQACPNNSVCRTLAEGFECQVNRTLSNIELTYTNNFPTSQNRFSTVTFNFRTRSTNAIMFNAESSDSNQQFVVTLVNGSLNVTYRWATVNSTSTLIVKNTPVNNANWFALNITLTPVFFINLGYTQVNSNLMTPKLGPLSTLTLGSLNFEGCFGDIRVDGYLLPAFPPTQLIKDLSPNRFNLSTQTTPLKGYQVPCVGRNVCDGACQNGAQCKDVFNDVECTCTKGYFGNVCAQANCSAVNCLNGAFCTIVNNTIGGSIQQWKCECNKGWTGDTCDVDIDECSKYPNICKNNATCTNLMGDFNCACLLDYVGKTCYKKNPCLDSACKNGNCSVDLQDANENALFNCQCFNGWVKGSSQACDQQINIGLASSSMWIIIGICIVITIVLLTALAYFLYRAKVQRARHGVYNPYKKEVNGAQLHMNQVLKPPPEERLI